jgi:hypothetical protein
MPSKTAKQARTMRAAAHDPVFAKKIGIPQGIAKEFVVSDTKMKKPAFPTKGKSKR